MVFEIMYSTWIQDRRLRPKFDVLSYVIVVCLLVDNSTSRKQLTAAHKTAGGAQHMRDIGALIKASKRRPSLTAQPSSTNVRTPPPLFATYLLPSQLRSKVDTIMEVDEEEEVHNCPVCKLNLDVSFIHPRRCSNVVVSEYDDVDQEWTHQLLQEILLAWCSEPHW